MRSAASGTRELRDAMAQAIASSSGLVGAIDTTEDQTEEYERTIAGLARDSVQAAATQEFLEQGIDNAGEAAISAAAAMRTYESRVDEVGDESVETAAESAALASSLQAAAAAAGGASVNMGPLNTSIKSAIVALPVLIGLLGSLSAALGGVAIAGGGAVGALGALFAGGLIGRAEAMAAASSELEGRGEALERIMTQLGSAIDEAAAPLQTLASQEAAMSVLAGLVTLVGDLSRSAARLREAFAPVAARLGETFWAEEARGIAELEKAITDLLPILEDLAFAVLAGLPDLIAWLRSEALRVVPALGDFATSAIPVVRELAEIGSTLLRLTLPALSLLLDALVPILDLFTLLPDSLIVAAAAFGVVSAALVTYGGVAALAASATAALDAAITALLAKLGAIATVLSGGTVLLVAALVAAVVGAITYFDLWDDILRSIVGAWNSLVEVIEFAVNAFVNLSRSIESFLGPATVLIPVIGQLMWLIANWGEVVQAVTQFVDRLTGAWENFAKSVMKYVDPVLDALGRIEEQVDRTGGVSLEGAKIDTPSAAATGGPSRKGQRETMEGAPRGIRERAREIRKAREEYNFNFSGATFNGDTSQRDVERAVKRALERQRSRSSDM